MMEKPKQLRFAWSRDKLKAMSDPETYTLRRGGIDYAKVQKTWNGWFTYGVEGCPVFFNTANRPTSFLTAKEKAVATIREALKEDKPE